MRMVYTFAFATFQARLEERCERMEKDMEAKIAERFRDAWPSDGLMSDWGNLLSV